MQRSKPHMSCYTFGDKHLIKDSSPENIIQKHHQIQNQQYIQHAVKMPTFHLKCVKTKHYQAIRGLEDQEQKDATIHKNVPYFKGTHQTSPRQTKVL